MYASKSRLSVSLNKSKTDHLIFSTSSLHDNKYQLLIVGRMVAHSIHRANVCEKDTKWIAHFLAEKSIFTTKK